MKMPISLLVCMVTGTTLAGEFINLTFNDPDFSRLRITETGAPVGPVEDLLRGWEVSVRQPFGQWRSFRDEIQFTLSGAGLSPIALNFGKHLDKNNYSVLFDVLAPIGIPSGPVPPDVRLSTTGTVPENAVTFDLYALSVAAMTISDGDRTLSGLTSINVTQFAGKEVTISFFVPSGGYGSLDVVGFILVPEPETWALLGLGVAGLFAWRQCKRE